MDRNTEVKMHTTLPVLINELKDQTEERELEWQHPAYTTHIARDEVKVNLKPDMPMSDSCNIQQGKLFGFVLGYTIKLNDGTDFTIFNFWRWDANWKKVHQTFEMAKEQIKEKKKVDIDDFVEGISD